MTRGIERTPGMNGTRTRPSESSAMIAQIWASAFVGGRERRHLVPEGVEPEPRLAGVVPRLVHHSPLAAEQVLLRGEVLEVAAVREEEQRPSCSSSGRSGRSRASAPSSAAAAGHRKQVRHQGRDRAVARGREPGRARRVAVARAPSPNACAQACLRGAAGHARSGAAPPRAAARSAAGIVSGPSTKASAGSIGICTPSSALDREVRR